MSDCCEFLIRNEANASALEVSEPAGTLVVQDGPTLTVNQSVTVLQMHEAATLSLEVSPPVYQVYPESEVALTKRVDFDDANDKIYKGEANPGTLDGDAGWRIQEVTFVGTDEDVIVKWAEGNASFDKVWDNHLSYPYI